MKRYFFSFFFLAIVAMVFPQHAYAGGATQDQFYIQGQVNYNNTEVNKQTQAFTGSQGANLGRVKDTREVIASLIQSFLVVLGTLFLVYMVYAGYLILTSAGIDERVEKGKNILRNAIIGLAIVLFSYAGTWFIRWLFVATGDQTYKDCVPYSTDVNGDPLDASGNLISDPKNGC
ncbi:MAG: hypothetical protein COU32_01595 [Candidatus Magasanikbacteria bacterium CG10_big_fil_rev_8_21_14_0_10_42_10]|uniref:Uncharacterized protein n=2 Tax=Candidatus Magasanikiibacteriota TaxID=1752731 RepID=A0A2H0TWK0_9BACT|nr:MAG: hypothetical protein COU32_01595 [Candidatus Magasanikbacteria bacterium CG10_big_fil_rev_8_21_14_0_10_42_10]PIZ94540.1 MAG: hypothetical protein COX82_00455 [Candidatus Magasanikbacteria bacterium CG_4_10_14_0_2_um_filter_41_10]